MANNILDLIGSTETAKLDKTYSEVFKKNPLEEAMDVPGPKVDQIDILRDKMFKKAAELWNTTPAELEEAMKKISYHETGRTLSPTSRQVGGPAGGFHHFEQEPSALYPTASGSANIAGERMFNFMTNTTINEKGKRVSKTDLRGLDYKEGDALKIMKMMSDDFSKVDPRLQDVAFLANYLEHPSSKSNLGKALKTKEGMKEFYLDVHWAGELKDRSEREGSWDKSMEHYNIHGR